MLQHILNISFWIVTSIPGKLSLKGESTHKTGIFPFQYRPKNLEPSYKTDLEFLDCFAREKVLLLTSPILTWKPVKGP